MCNDTKLYDGMMNYEEYIELKKKLHVYLQSVDIQSMLNLSNELITGIEEHLLTKIQFREFYTKSMLYYVIGYLGGIIFSCFFKRNRYCRCNDKDALEKKVILISARALYNRFQNLAQMSEDYGVVYMPDISYENMDKHLEEHELKGNSVYVISHSFIDCILFILAIFKLIPTFIRIKKYSHNNELDQFCIDRLVLVSLLKFVAGNIVIRNKFKRSDTVFVSDYDKSIDLLILKHHREQYGINYRIGSLNHGAFVGFNLSYVCPCADFIMCTCNREVELTKKFLHSNSININAVGAPLQSFVDNYQSITAATESKGYLVLGTFAEGEWKENQKKLIRYIKSMGLEFKYRLRPASMDHDLRELSDILNLDDCTCNTTLSEDCDRFQNIITFSLDALNSCIRKTRNILIYVPQKVYDNYSPLGEDSDQIIITPVWNDVKSFLDKKHEESKYNEKTKQWITDNVGEQDFDKVVENIKKVINHYL